MKWEDVKLRYDNEWIIIEAINERTEGDNRIIEQLTVVDAFKDDNNKVVCFNHPPCCSGVMQLLRNCFRYLNGDLQKYVELHKAHPEREFYIFHTSRKDLNIKERRWVGVRRA